MFYLQNFSATLISVLLMATAPMSPIPVPVDTSLNQWEPLVGDHIVIDTKENVGYLIHTDGRYTSFPVVTGQRRWVRYIGLSYNAATPNWDWTVKSTHIKGDRITYGLSGRFFRMYKDGNEYTHYGIHEHRDEGYMFKEDDTRFKSMGCIIVKTHILDLIEKTYEKNGEAIEVVTRYGVEEPVEVAYAG